MIPQIISGLNVNSANYGDTIRRDKEYSNIANEDSGPNHNNFPQDNNDNRQRPTSSRVSSIKEILLTNFECCVESSFMMFSKVISLIGPFFLFALIFFVLLVGNGFFYYIIPFYFYLFNQQLLVPLFLIIIGLYFLYTVLSNYLLAALVKPGSLKDLKTSKYYKSNSPYICNEVDLSCVFKSRSNNYTARNLRENYENYKDRRYCKYCNEVKPIRAHHCTICNVCVFKMDHHCPWINNCVGQENHRYFLLFLTHIQAGCLFVSLCIAPIVFRSFFQFEAHFESIHKQNYYKNLTNNNNLLFVGILSLSGVGVLFFFNFWNWFLVFRGLTTLEFWAGGGENDKTRTYINDFTLNKLLDNFYMVFGTKNVIKAILIPSYKKLPFSGIEWTRLIHPLFSIDGLYDTLREEEDLEKDLEI